MSILFFQNQKLSLLSEEDSIGEGFFSMVYTIEYHPKSVVKVYKDNTGNPKAEFLAQEIAWKLGLACEPFAYGQTDCLQSTCLEMERIFDTPYPASLRVGSFAN